MLENTSIGDRFFRTNNTRCAFVFCFSKISEMASFIFYLNIIVVLWLSLRGNYCNAKRSFYKNICFFKLNKAIRLHKKYKKKMIIS